MAENGEIGTITGVTHFTGLHRTLHKYFLIWRCQTNNYHFTN